MQILVLGAGVIGSVYGARLAKAGHDVTVLARGRRLAQLRESGSVLLLRDDATGAFQQSRVRLTESLGPEDAYDLVIVAVQRTQLSAVLPMIAAARKVDRFLFFVNTAGGHAEWLAATGPGRLIVGFPGAGGTQREAITHYLLAPPVLQPTTLGDPSGLLEEPVRETARLLREAGFPVALCRNMDAWQKTHVGWVVPIAEALYRCGGSLDALASSPGELDRLVREVQFNFADLRRAGVPITPTRMRWWDWMPHFLLQWLLTAALTSTLGRLAIAPHAMSARAELTFLAGELDSFLTVAGGRRTAALRQHPSSP